MQNASDHIELESIKDARQIVEYFGQTKIIAISEPYIIRTCMPMMSMDISLEGGRRFLATGPDTLGSTEDWMSDLAAELRTHYGL